MSDIDPVSGLILYVFGCIAILIPLRMAWHIANFFDEATDYIRDLRKELRK